MRENQLKKQKEELERKKADTVAQEELKRVRELNEQRAKEQLFVFKFLGGGRGGGV